MRIISDTNRRCADCGEPLPRIAKHIFKQNEGCCPRCAFLHKDVGIAYDQADIRNMAIKGQSSIVVPRIEFHRPGQQPAKAVSV